MQSFSTAKDAALHLRPDEPVYCFRPEVLKADAEMFMDAFPGETAYAVKTNGEPLVLETLAKAGMRIFDVASPGEFAAVKAARPDAEMLYMHPVKAQSDIRLALETYGIRVLALDHEDEVAKVLRIVRALDLDPGTLTIFVRLQTKGHAMYELSKKFGAAPAHAVELLQRCHRIGFKVGICFHVGSQIEDPDTYERALASADWVRSRAGVPLAGLGLLLGIDRIPDMFRSATNITGHVAAAVTVEGLVGGRVAPEGVATEDEAALKPEGSVAADS